MVTLIPLPAVLLFRWNACANVISFEIRRRSTCSLLSASMLYRSQTVGFCVTFHQFWRWKIITRNSSVFYLSFGDCIHVVIRNWWGQWNTRWKWKAWKQRVWKLSVWYICIASEPCRSYVIKAFVELKFLLQNFNMIKSLKIGIPLVVYFSP